MVLLLSMFVSSRRASSRVLALGVRSYRTTPMEGANDQTSSTRIPLTSMRSLLTTHRCACSRRGPAQLVDLRSAGLEEPGRRQLASRGMS
jgi:hypothetical protein